MLGNAHFGATSIDSSLPSPVRPTSSSMAVLLLLVVFQSTLAIAMPMLR
jgi:hypothetical protein